MKRTTRFFLFLFSLLVANSYAHVPFLKPNQFKVLHSRLQIESSFTEFPFQADFAMDSPGYTLVCPDGQEIALAPQAKTCAAEYLEPTLNEDGTYRVNAGVRKGPKYKAIETTDGKLYFADDMKEKQGTPTFLQYYSCADTYLYKGQPRYQPRLLNQGLEIIPLSSPNALTPDNEIAFRVYQDGKPVPNARVVVAYDNEQYQHHRKEDLYDVENTRASNIYADDRGEFTFRSAQTGLVLLFVNVHHKVNDLLWESYNTSLTLEVNLP